MKYNVKLHLFNNHLLLIFFKEYYVLVAQLEHQFRLGQLSLQKFWFYIQPCIRTLDVLSSIAVAIDKGNCKGGSVLTLLHEKTVSFTGDNKGQDLCLFLTQAVSTILGCVLSLYQVDGMCIEFVSSGWDVYRMWIECVSSWY
ncbi:gamma-tubulin complex component 2-like [Exaiptasia diaphana]|uniref:Gamma-tubulin complex component n=1 Tax=Exaiptasia diaphana TaxID=2652724 RepID=A0A913YF27_EXADI|nr:gamma-tubulin complex component 2-like [Exaiptasia diaphana]